MSEEHTEKGPRQRPGPKLRGNTYRVTVLLTAEEHAMLLEYCERAQVSHAQAVRDGLRCLAKAQD